MQVTRHPGHFLDRNTIEAVEGQIEMDGLNILRPHLNRSDVVTCLANLVQMNRFVLVNSPASSGKSSLIRLLAHGRPDYQCVGFSFMKYQSTQAADALRLHGCDLQRQEITIPIREDCSLLVIVIDDAQEKYNDLDFWCGLVKDYSLLADRCPKLRFIISTVHALGSKHKSPVEFEAMSKISRKDMLLTDDECLEYLSLTYPSGLHSCLWDAALIEAIQAGCGRLIGALSQTVKALNHEVGKAYKSRLPYEASDALRFLLSYAYLQSLTRCFGSSISNNISSELKSILIECLFDRPLQKNNITSTDDLESITELIKSGILVEDAGSYVEFTSPVAKRFYSRKLFPNRALSNPTSLTNLLKKTIEAMSASLLAKADSSNGLPNEATFQHLFFTCLASNTRGDCQITAELSKTLSSTHAGKQFLMPCSTTVFDRFVGQQIPGRIDFFINGDLLWGLELLVQGRDIGEHLSRFDAGQPYSKLGCSDYAVVDIRSTSDGCATNVLRHPKRMTLFFRRGDFSTCRCIVGVNGPEEVLTLQP
jgi:hypothetical protein